MEAWENWYKYIKLESFLKHYNIVSSHFLQNKENLHTHFVLFLSAIRKIIKPANTREKKRKNKSVNLDPHHVTNWLRINIDLWYREVQCSICVPFFNFDFFEHTTLYFKISEEQKMLSKVLERKFRWTHIYIYHLPINW